MTGQIAVRSTSVTTNRRQPLTSGTPTPTPKPTHKKSKSNVGEVAGNTTADICVVCCCCPCVLFEFLILAVYKVPSTVVRRMWKKHRRKISVNMIKNPKNPKIKSKKEVNGNGGGEVHVVNVYQHQQHRLSVVGYADELSDVDLKEFEKVKVSIDGSAEAVELDKQMWDRFRDAGFWRSPSQRFEDES